MLHIKFYLFICLFIEFSGTDSVEYKREKVVYDVRMKMFGKIFEIFFVLVFGGLIRFTQEYFSNEPHLKHDDEVYTFFTGSIPRFGCSCRSLDPDSGKAFLKGHDPEVSHKTPENLLHPQTAV